MDLKQLFLEPFKAKGLLVGVDKGRHSLKIVVINRTPSGFELEDFLIKDFTGVDEKERLDYSKKALADFLREKNIFQGEAFVVVGEEDVFSTRLTMPHMPVNELRKALLWETRDILPFTAEEATVDYQVIAEKLNDDGTKSIDLIFVAVRNKAVKEGMSLFGGTGLSIENVCAVIGALINVVGFAKNIETKKPIAILEFGHAHATICVFKEKKLIFSRNLSIGLDDVANSMVGSISSTSGITELTYEDAGRIIEKYGMPVENQLIGVKEGSLDSRRLASMMRPALENLVKDISKSFAYLAENFSEEEVSKVYLIGGGAKLKNLDKFLKDQLNIDVEVFKLENIVPVSTNISEDKKIDLSHITSIVGAMLAEGGGVNFLPFEFRKKRWHILEKMSFRVTSITIVAILLVAYAFVSLQYTDYKRRHKIMQLYVDTLQRLKISKGEIDKMGAVLSAMRRGSINTVVVLRELSNRTPKNVLLDWVNFSQSDGNLKIKGVIYANEEAAGALLSEYIKNMENSPFFEKVNLSSSQRSGDNGKPSLNFDIEFKIEPGVK